MAANAVLHHQIKTAVDHLRQAAQFLANGLCLADKRSQHPVFGSLLIEEVPAIHVWIWLEFAVNATVPLLHAAGVPRYVKMEDIPAVCLEIESLACRICGDQNADRMFCRIGVESGFDSLTLI